MLGEAIEIIQQLWQGEELSYRGRHFRVDRARLWDRPSRPPSLAVAAGGPKAAELAGKHGAGLFATETRPELVQAWSRAGGRGARYAEVALCWARDEATAVRTAHDRFRFGAIGWQGMTELATPAAFEAATALVRPEDFAQKVACGPDPERHIGMVRQYLKAGFDHLVLLGVGPDQEGFFKFWKDELAPRLRKLGDG